MPTLCQQLKNIVNQDINIPSALCKAICTVALVHGFCQNYSTTTIHAIRLFVASGILVLDKSKINNTNINVDVVNIKYKKLQRNIAFIGGCFIGISLFAIQYFRSDLGATLLKKSKLDIFADCASAGIIIWSILNHLSAAAFSYKSEKGKPIYERTNFIPLSVAATTTIIALFKIAQTSITRIAR